MPDTTSLATETETAPEQTPGPPKVASAAAKAAKARSTRVRAKSTKAAGPTDAAPSAPATGTERRAVRPVTPARARAALDALPTPVLVLDTDGRVEWANTRGRAALDERVDGGADAVVGQHLRDLGDDAGAGDALPIATSAVPLDLVVRGTLLSGDLAPLADGRGRATGQVFSWRPADLDSELAAVSRDAGAVVADLVEDAFRATSTTGLLTTFLARIGAVHGWTEGVAWTPTDRGSFEVTATLGQRCATHLAIGSTPAPEAVEAAATRGDAEVHLDLDDLDDAPSRALVEAGLRSAVCLTVRQGDATLAVLQFLAGERAATVATGPASVATLVRCVAMGLGRMAREQAALDQGQNARAVTEVLNAVAAAPTAAAAVAAALDTVREAFGWDYGSFWRLDADAATLRFDQESGTVNDEFRAVTMEATFDRGVGLAGRTWEAGELQFARDLGTVTDCVRAPAARRAGVRSGVCIPIVVDGDTVGTMDFFALETIELSEGRLEALRSVGRSVSAGLDRVLRAERAVEQAANAGAVTEVIAAVAAAASVPAAVSAVLDTVREAFGWDYGSFWRLDADAATLRFDQESGTVNDEFRAVTMEATFDRGVGLAGRTWEAGELQFARDLGTVTDCVRAPAARRAGVRSGVCIPIVVQGETIGTMDFFALETIELSEGRLEALRSVGQSLSAGLERARQTDRAREQAANATAMTRVIEALTRTDTREAAVRAALDTVRDAFDWDYGSYWALDADAQTLRFALESGTVTDAFRRVTMEASFDRGVGVAGRAWATRDLVFERDLGTVTDCVRAPAARDAGVRSGVCLPVVVAGEVVGTMDFFALETIELSDARLETLRSVGHAVSSAVDSIVAAERERVQTDRLRADVDRMLAVVDAAADGDLTQTIVRSGDDAMAQMGDALGRLLGDLRGSIGQISASATALAGASAGLEQVSEGMGANARGTLGQAAQVREGSEQVSSNVEAVAAAAEEMTTSIREISQNTAHAANVAGHAVAAARTTNATIGKLGDSSTEIGKIVKVITGIAQQTNLLALNATIEAARAGEAGKGFAVVANEVKELAKETARATEDISAKIETIQADTGSAVEAINEISAIINEISDIQTTIASAVEEQAATTTEIARSVNDASRSTGEITRNIRVVEDAAGETAAGADQTRSSAVELRRMAAELEAAVGRFTT